MPGAPGTGDLPTLARALGLACLLLLPGLLPSSSVAAEPPARYVVGLSESHPPVTVGDTLAGGQVIEVLEALPAAVVLAEAPVAEARDVTYLAPDPVVAWAQAGPPLPLGPSDPRYHLDQYGPQQVGAPRAWQLSMGDASVALCVVDSGISLDHEDVSRARYLGGIDLVWDDQVAEDQAGHGTWVAGIAAAETGNARGIAGIAQAGLLVAKVLDAEGRAPASRVAEGILWCLDQGAAVINLSLGQAEASPVLTQAIEAAWQAGAVLVGSAGNVGPCEGCVLQPAADPRVIAVAGTDAQAQGDPRSASGPEVELAAPSVDVLGPSAGTGHGYHAATGTSASAAHVSGAVALLLSLRPELGASQVRHLLNGTAMAAGEPGWDPSYGHGILDIGAAASTFLPGPPRLVTARPGPQAASVTVTWQPPLSDGGRSIEGYRLERADQGGAWIGIASLPAGQHRFVDESLLVAPPVAHSYRLRAVTGTGLGAASEPACTTAALWQAASDDLCQAAGMVQPRSV